MQPDFIVPKFEAFLAEKNQQKTDVRSRSLGDEPSYIGG